MVRLNRTNRNVLITPDEVIFHSPSTGEEGERLLLNNIIVAEERFIANALGFDLYEYICEQKNRTVTTENIAQLRTKLQESYSAVNVQFADDLLRPGMIVNSIDFVSNEWITKLWKQYLWKITAECVDLMAIVPSWLQTTKSGQQLLNPKTLSATGSVSGERNDIKLKMDNAMQERIDPLLERMHQWICRHKAHFPLYKKSCADCECREQTTDKEVSSQTGFAFGHYD